MRAHETAHVLDAADDADVRRREELDDTLRVEVCSVLRADDDDGAGNLEHPRQLLLKIGGPGREVDDQVVERAPIGAGDELTERDDERLGYERQRLPFSEQEPDGHQLQAVAFDRRQPHGAATPDVPALERRLALEVDHQRNVRAVEVGVEQADVGTIGTKCEREIQRDRRLADAAFAARNCDRVTCG